MFSNVIIIMILVRELFNFLKKELKGKTDVTSIVAIIALMAALCLKSAGL